MNSGQRDDRLRIAASLLLLALFAALGWAQETTAGLQGTVKDVTGALVPKATVEVRSPALLGVKKMDTDVGGYYRFSNLPPGEYTLTVSCEGFRTYRQTGILLMVGRLPSIDVALPVGTVAETVEVSEAAPIVDVTQSKVAVAVPQDVLQNVPKGRSFQSVIPFAPGARQEPLQSTDRGTRGIAGFQIDGASDAENSYLVEGMDTTDINLGGAGQNVPMEWRCRSRAAALKPNMAAPWAAWST